MTPGLALFVKTPGRSPVKSRLWPAIGRKAAEALYLDCAEAGAEVARALQRAGTLHAYWAVAEAEDDAPPVWRELPRLPQGEGDLGERMAAVYDALLARHGAALLVGTDVPHLPPEALAEACDALSSARADVVLGPSDDGGFWLVGGTRALPHSAWTAPRYSTPHARADFIAALPTDVCMHLLPTLRDLDEADDFAPVHAALAALPAPTPAQARVLRRLDALLATMPG